MTENHKKYAVGLIIILIIASFFRLWKLDSIPPGLYSDVAMNGNDALNSLQTGDFKVFYPENNGREGLMMWLIALSFSIFGPSIWSIKIVAAITGILTVFGLYLLTKEMFDSQNFSPMKQGETERKTNFHQSLIVNSQFVALLSSFFLAVSFWHINFSRIGFRAILLPFVLVFAFYFLFKGFRTKKIYHFIIAGLFFGLGFYTYTSFRVAVLILPFILIPYWFIYKKQSLQKYFLLFTVSFLITTFLVALPIGVYFLKNPQDFISRAAPVSVFASKNPLKELGKSLILHLGMFNFYGDPNWRHNFAGSPMLFWPIGILFLVGFFIILRELFRKSNYQNQNYQLITVSCFLVSAFFIMLLPGVLTYEGIPHALRAIGVIPPVYIFAGLGGWYLYQWLNKFIKNKKWVILFLIFFLLGITFNQFDKYFVKWANREEVKEAFSKDLFEIGIYLNSLPSEVQKYVIVNELNTPLYGISIPAQTPMFLESTLYGQPRSTYLKAENLDQIEINQKPTVIIPFYDGSLFDELQKRFPQGTIEKKDNFSVYKIYYEKDNLRLKI